MIKELRGSNTDFDVIYTWGLHSKGLASGLQEGGSYSILLELVS